MDPVEQLLKRPESQIVAAFQQQLLNFVDDISTVLPGESDLVAIHLFFNTAPPEDIINHFANHILPLRDRVDNRDDDFFLKEADIFGELEKHKVDHFKHLWSSPDLSAADRQIIWRYFDVFIKLAEGYRRVTSH